MHHNRRSAIKIMSRLIVLVRPLIHLMVLAVLLGSAGYLCAIFLTIAAAYGLLRELAGNPSLCRTILQSLYCVSSACHHPA